MIKLKDLILEIRKNTNCFGLGQFGPYDEIQFEWIPSADFRSTEHSTKFPYRSTRRFRFYFSNGNSKTGIVYWGANLPTQEEMHKIDDFFNKQSISVIHRDFKLNLISEGWNGMLQAQFYWLSKEGKGVKVNHHQAYASTASKNNHNNDEAYQWMFDHGWARITIEDNYIFINTSNTDPAEINLTKQQKTWLKLMRDEIYPAQHLEFYNIYRKKIEI